MKMLKADIFKLFADLHEDNLVGVVKSQTDAKLVYACRLTKDGAFSCCTQNLRPCGGLDGSLCKHLIVLVIGLTKGGELDPWNAFQWMMHVQDQPVLDKELMSEVFIRYKGVEAGQIDWRPTETVPEDYFAF